MNTNSPLANSVLNESNNFFLQYNNLAQRFCELPANKSFFIGEVNFGFGLNFVSCLKLWRSQQRAPNSYLHYLAFEQHPLPTKELIKLLAKYPEFCQESAELSAQYYLLLPAYHRLHFAKNVSLTIIIGDISQNLAEFTTNIDAWFFNYFTQLDNTLFQNSTIAQNLARISNNNTTFVMPMTDIIACDRLEKSGFKFSQQQDSANLQKFLYGSYTLKKNQKIVKVKPWFKYDLSSFKPQKPHIAIIGAGISGAATAYSLALRGYQVSVYEQHANPATEASGNYQGMLYASWSAFGGEMMELSAAGYRYSHALITQLLKVNEDYGPCGLIQLAHNETQKKRNQQLINANLADNFCQALSHQQIEKLAQQKIASNLDGIFFPYGLWLKPHKLVKALLKHPNIQLINNCQIDKFIYDKEQWLLYDKLNQLVGTTTILVLANAHYVNHFQQASYLPLRKIRGQISIAQSQQSVATVLCGKAYITPASQGKFTIGASFKFNDDSIAIRQEEHLENMSNLKEISNPLYNTLDFHKLEGQANFRTSTYDYFPVVGPLAKHTEFIQTFAKLGQDANANFKETTCTNYPNLYLNLAHGAKGILTAPICGEIIADYIEQSPLPCSEGLRTMLHPNRLYVKQLVKKQL